MSEDAPSAASASAPPPPPDAPPPPETPQQILLRVAKRFLVPFLGSWAVAYVGSTLDLEWLFFAGLGGVGLSMIVLLVWLVH